MKQIILLAAIVISAFSVKAQNVDRTIHSDRNVTTLSGGTSTNVEKIKDYYIWILKNGNGNNWVAIHDAPFNSGKSTSRQSYNLYATRVSDQCMEYWTTEEGSNRMVLFELCEESATPYVKMTKYAADETTITKVVYYYFD